MSLHLRHRSRQAGSDFAPACVELEGSAESRFHILLGVAADGGADLAADVASKWIASQFGLPLVEDPHDGEYDIATAAFYDEVACCCRGDRIFVAAIDLESEASKLDQSDRGAGIATRHGALDVVAGYVEPVTWTYQGIAHAFVNAGRREAQVTFGGLPGALAFVATVPTGTEAANSAASERLLEATAWYGFGWAERSDSETLASLREKLALARKR
jgi:hypothetical protein